MHAISARIALAAIALVGALALPGIASAQDNGVPPQLLDNSRTATGDTIRFCVDDYGPGGKFDRAVGQAIADALLVKAAFAPAPTGFPLDGAGYLDELQLILNTTCDVMAGISLSPNGGESLYPDWATVTRPYAQVPFVLAVKADSPYTALKDIPFSKRVGTTMGSLGQGVMITYIGQQPADKRWLQLPYADPKLMLKRLLDGTIEGMVIWQPSLNQITDNDPAKAGVKIIPLDPVQPVSASVGELVSSRDSYLRSQIDQAIGTLVSDGTIAKLMQENGYQGTPGG
jgi:polar amino acid transport system substrate-binding protein